MAEEAGKLRVDKWLWHARFFKTRSLATKTVGAGIRVNGVPIGKPAFGVGVGDVLTFAQSREVRVIRIEALGTRRGPAPEAQALYTDLDPPKPHSEAPATPRAPKFDGKGRPTKRDRRQMEKSRPDMLE